jgi:outer membrane receptor protein involved in Fe transport
MAEIKKLEPVIVTGSHIPTLEAETVAPVLQFDRAEIEKAGLSNLGEILMKIPQNTSGAMLENNASAFNPGSAGVSLRGLGQQSTLVLINGRRIAPYGFPQNFGIPQSFVDLNSIPLAAVERIEILKEGASAIYGADAVAGVVNVILRKDYAGFEVSSGYGNTTAYDSGELSFSMLGGSSNEKTSVMVVADYFRRNAQHLRDRPISASADHRSQGGIDRRSSSSVIARIFDPNTGDSLFVPPNSDGTLTAAELATVRPDLNRYNFNQDIVDYPETERYGAYITLNHQITEKLTAFFEGSFRRILTHYAVAPTPIFEGDATIGPDNPFNPFPGEAVDFRYRANEVGPRISDIQTDAIRTVAGLRLRLPDWEMLKDWEAEAAFLYSRSDSKDISSNYITQSALQGALNDSNSLTAFNILRSPYAGQFGVAVFQNNPDTLARLRTRLSHDSVTELLQYDGRAAGTIFELPGGRVGLALGVEQRKEHLADNPDTLQANGSIVALGGTSPTVGNRDATSLYGELAIPVFTSKNARPFLQDLEFQVAGRFESYSDFGDTAKPKVGMKWSPAKPVLFRGSYSAGFRAPSLPELFTARTVSFLDGLIDTDRNNIPGATITFPDYAAGAKQFQLISGGNPNLKPEESESWTAGVVIEPPYAVTKGLTVSIDWWMIQILDVVAQQDPQFILDNSSLFPGAITRLAPDPALPGDIGEVDSIDTAFVNLASRKVYGIDLEGNYIVPSSLIPEDFGEFTLNYSGSYILSWKERSDPTADAVELSGYWNLPKYRSTASAFWAYKRVSVGITNRFVQGYNDDPFGEVDDWITWDFQASVEAPWDSTITVGVLNFTDNPPPFTRLTTEGYDTANHDNRGRFVYVKATKRF